jgi:hypothetical protein
MDFEVEYSDRLLVLGDVVHDRARILARAVAALAFTCAFGSGVAEDRAKAATTTGADMPTGKVAPTPGLCAEQSFARFGPTTPKQLGAVTVHQLMVTSIQNRVEPRG